MTAHNPTPLPTQARATLTGARAVLELEDAASEILTADPGEDLRGVVIEHITRLAVDREEDVELRTVGDRGEHRLLVTATGEVSRLPAAPDEEPFDAALPTPDAPVVPVEDPVVEPEPMPAGRGATTQELPQGIPADTALWHERQGIPQVEASEVGDATSSRPARGWRAAGKRPAGRAHALADDRTVVAQHWPGCRKIAVTHVMGGQGRTTLAAMVAAVFGRFGGGAVLAWDNGDTIGSLGWRTDEAPHRASIPNVLASAESLLAPDAGVSAIAGYVHHQTEDHFDVLRKSPSLFGDRAKVTTEEFERLLAVADRYYRMVIFDGGGDPGGQRWERMLAATDQLIVPVAADVHSAEGALDLLHQMRQQGGHVADLANNAVVVINQHRPPVDGRTLRAVTAAFDGVAGAVEVLGTDPGLGYEILRFDALRRPTRDTLVRIAAHAAREMNR